MPLEKEVKLFLVQNKGKTQAALQHSRQNSVEFQNPHCNSPCGAFRCVHSLQSFHRMMLQLTDRRTDRQTDRQTSFQVLQEHGRTAAAPFGSAQGCDAQSSSPEQLRPARVPGPEGRPVIVPGNYPNSISHSKAVWYTLRAIFNM